MAFHVELLDSAIHILLRKISKLYLNQSKNSRYKKFNTRIHTSLKTIIAHKYYESVRLFLLYLRF